MARGRDTLKESLTRLVAMGMTDEQILSGVSLSIRGAAISKLRKIRERVSA